MHQALKTSPNDKRMLPYGGSFSIQDTQVIEFITGLNLTNSLWVDDINYQFCEKYFEWITDTKNNVFKGLENFPYKLYSNGTSQTFDLFYIKNKNRRFRCLHGEYIYHQLAWRNSWPDWKFIDDLDLESNDAVVVSLPFADTGDEHKLKEILAACEEKNIPVLIDCAYFGTCKNVEFDLSYNCITDVAFSLSKIFPVAHARIGMRLTKHDDDDLMLVYDKINYNNRIGARLGLELITNFNSDYICDKYAANQILLCNQLDVTPSKTILFGLDYHSKYPEYNRGGAVNRLGLHKVLNV